MRQLLLTVGVSYPYYQVAVLNVVSDQSNILIFYMQIVYPFGFIGYAVAENECWRHDLIGSSHLK